MSDQNTKSPLVPCTCSPWEGFHTTTCAAKVIDKAFDEIGDAIARIEVDAHAHGLTGQMLAARDCMRAVAAIRTKYLGEEGARGTQ